MIKHIALASTFIFAAQAVAGTQISEGEFLYCSDLSDTIYEYKQELQEQSNNLDNLLSRYTSAGRVLDALNVQYNNRTHNLRMCQIGTPGYCGGQATAVNNAAERFNQLLNRIRKLEYTIERKEDIYNADIKDYNQGIDRYNQKCIDVSVKKEVFNKHCTGDTYLSFCDNFE